MKLTKIYLKKIITKIKIYICVGGGITIVIHSAMGVG
jgi:hypothetical protein